jgi:hypothetical protein
MPAVIVAKPEPKPANGSHAARRPDRDKAVKLLAKSLYRDLRQQGFDPRHIVALASELIGQVTATGGAMAPADIVPDDK